MVSFFQSIARSDYNLTECLRSDQLLFLVQKFSDCPCTGEIGVFVTRLITRRCQRQRGETNVREREREVENHRELWLVGSHCWVSQIYMSYIFLKDIF